MSLMKTVITFNGIFTTLSFFAFTVATTIGYGNVAPQTATGKMFTAVYALIAIPLVGSCPCNLGRHRIVFYEESDCVLHHQWDEKSV